MIGVIPLSTATAQLPSAIGEWAPLQTLPFAPVHSILLPTGKVLIYIDGVKTGPLLWDPDTGNLTPTATGFGYNAFCNGHVLIADGRVMFTGGHLTPAVGLPNASYYDPFTDTFTGLPQMNAGRWYPSQVTLANGDVVTMAGSIEQGPGGAQNLIPEVWEVKNNSWRELSDAELLVPRYPAAFLAPNGKVFVAMRHSRYLDTSGAGSWAEVSAHQAFGRDNYGSACMYEVGLVIYTGGGNPPLASCEVIDLLADSPAWDFVAPMPQARRQHDTTILPDGRVLVTGGSSSSGFNTDDGAKAAMAWDPVTNSWDTWATEQEYRGYHSEALLLPDGRVASFGGDDHPNLQVFSPPYLFQGARPTITSAPASVGYGEHFFVETPDGASILYVNWVRPGAVTHTTNMNQRINGLEFSQVSGGLDVVVPSSSTACPPGHYMLFLLNDLGVPSVARIINVQPCPWDLNGDAVVDSFDLAALFGAWCSAVNDPNPPSPPCENCTPANLAVADITGPGNAPDGCVDAFDLAKLLAEWCSVAGGNPCGTCGR